MNNSHYLDIKPVEELVHEIGVEKVFGEPVKDGAVTLIPVAQVAFGFGYGAGSEGSETNGHGSVSDVDTEEKHGEGEAGGGGAGGGGRATPRGFIRIEEGHATYSPIEDDRMVHRHVL